FIFVSLLLAGVLVALDYYLPGSFLQDFLNNHFIETFAALVGFNIAAVVFLVGQLMNLEEKYNGNMIHTRKEIKHNAYFLLSSFLICLCLLILRPDIKIDPSFHTNAPYYILNVLVLSVFGLAIFSIYEILH